VRIASLNSSLSLGVLDKKGPLEHVRDHIQRVGSRDLSFCREIGNRTEFGEMRNMREVKHRAKTKTKSRGLGHEDGMEQGIFE